MQLQIIKAMLIMAILAVLGTNPATAQLLYPSGDGVTYATVNHAHNNQGEYAGRIRSLAGQVISIESQMDGARNDAARLANEVNALRAQKARVLDEYRRGQFCTGCDTARSDFAPGETFPHAGQDVRPATPAELAAKEKEFDDRIKPKAAQIQPAQNRYDSLKSQRVDLTTKLLNLEIPNWQSALNAEGTLRQRDWQKEKKDLEAKIAQAKKNRDDTVNNFNRAKAQKPPNAAVLEGLKISIDALNSQLDHQQKELPLRRDARQREMNDFVKSVAGTRADLQAACRRIRNDLGLFDGASIVSKLAAPTFYSFAVTLDGNALQMITPVNVTITPNQYSSDGILDMLEAGTGGNSGFGVGGSTPSTGGNRPTDIVER